MTPFGPVFASKLVWVGIYVAVGMTGEALGGGVLAPSLPECRVVLSWSEEESRLSSGWVLEKLVELLIMLLNSSCAAEVIVRRHVEF